MSQSTDYLRTRIANDDLLIIAGTGVSINATQRNPLASWTGLLEHGVDRCRAVVPTLTCDWANRVRADIHSGDIVDILCAAEKVSSKLNAPDGGRYKRWLRETVGSLKVSDPAVIDALVKLKVPIATTNYDSLIERVSGLPTITWKQKDEVQQFLRDEEQAVLHLHGHWRDSESVILGMRSYAKILDDEYAQTMQQVIAMTRTIMFVGFGDGLVDPNFEGLRRWHQRIHPYPEHYHFRLARCADVPKLERQHLPHENIIVIPYGEKYDHLPGFLRELAPTPPPIWAELLLVMNQSIEEAREKDYRYRTAHLLWALLEKRDSVMAFCLRQQGESVSIHRFLNRLIRCELPKSDRGLPFEPFEWETRTDVQSAQEYARNDRAACVYEKQLLLGILNSESGTVERLQQQLGNNGFAQFVQSVLDAPKYTSKT